MKSPFYFGKRSRNVIEMYSYVSGGNLLLATGADKRSSHLETHLCDNRKREPHRGLLGTDSNEWYPHALLRIQSALKVTEELRVPLHQTPATKGTSASWQHGGGALLLFSRSKSIHRQRHFSKVGLLFAPPKIPSLPHSSVSENRWIHSYKSKEQLRNTENKGPKFGMAELFHAVDFKGS